MGLGRSEKGERTQSARWSRPRKRSRGRGGCFGNACLLEVFVSCSAGSGGMEAGVVCDETFSNVRRAGSL